MKTPLMTLIDNKIKEFELLKIDERYQTTIEQNAVTVTLRELNRIKIMYESEPEWEPVTPAIKALGDVQHFGNLLSFIERVGEMRTAQKNFFKTRGKASEAEIRKWLGESKRLEREVDELLTKFNERNSAQTKMF